MPNYTQAVNNSSKATKDNNKALNDNKKALENQKKTLEDNQKSINSLLDMTVKMIKRQKEAEKEALKQSLDSYKKKIDLMKKSLDIQKDEYNYQKELSDKNSEINKTKNKLSALQFDDSAEAQKKRKELQEKLKKDEEDLQKFLYDNGIERQKKALDDEYNQFKDSTDKRVKTLENYINQEGKIRQDAMKLIESKSQEFYNNLMQCNIIYGDGMASTVVNAWNKAYLALNKFHFKQIDVSSTLATISQGISKITLNLETANQSMNNLSNSSKETAKALNLTAREYKNSKNTENENEISKLERLIKILESQKGSYPALIHFKRKLYELKGYASGTFSAKRGLATVDEKGKEIIFNKSPFGKYRFMNEGDVVFSHEATKKLWNFANSKSNLIGQRSFSMDMKEKIYSKISNNFSPPIININIKGNADNEIVKALKQESENIVKKAIQETFKTANKYASII